MAQQELDQDDKVAISFFKKKDAKSILRQNFY